jgi:cytochrome P450
MCSASFRIVTRTANRLLLGKELCANEEFLTLAVEYSDIFFGGANLIRHYPECVKPWVMYFKTDIRIQQGIAKKHLAPLIKQRLAAREEAKRQGREAEFEKTKPSDTLQWVLDIRLLHILVAAVHTSSVTFLNSMYDLALHPEIHQELRQEIRNVFASTNGEWTKPGLTKLIKLDSFIKESARFHPFQAGKAARNP